MDVNEKIAEAYFENIHGYVVNTNHYFKKSGDGGGAGPADIDLIMIHPKKGKYGKYAIATVKGWQSATTTLKQLKNKDKFEREWKIFQKDELKEAKKFFGHNNFSKIMVMPPIKPEEREECKHFVEKKYDYILIDFPEMIKELLTWLNSKSEVTKGENWERAYESEFMQTLRIITINFLKLEENSIKIDKKLLKLYNIQKDYQSKFSYGSINIKKRKNG
ncbi:hypothetical protein GOV04_00570 [Candidatus Woesearchaeota archaeon]|nr:hypothetical protein [Candidatus Woesearchaeota archaeon]